MSEDSGAADRPGTGPDPAGGSRPRVVVVGGGFAGLSALHALRGSGAAVTLVDRNVYSTFQPLLYQVATAGLTSSDVAYPLWSVTRKTGTRFHRGKLESVDAIGRRARLDDGTELRYDYLILATGVSASFFGIPGAEKNSLSLYTRRDAVALRERLEAELERRSWGGVTAGLAITIAGGGPTGVELAGTVAELRNIAVPAAFPAIDTAAITVTLIEKAPVLLAAFKPKEQEYARRQLVARGVDVHLGATIRELTAGEVLLADGTSVPSDITVWAAGVAAPEWSGRLGLAQGHSGRFVTGPDLRVQGQDRIFAAGDISVSAADPVAQLAQPAIQQGRHAAGADPAAAGGPGDGAVPLSRQGRHGHDRQPLGRGRAAGRHPAAGHAGLAGLARPAPVHAAGQPAAAGHPGQPVLAVPDLEPGRRHHRRRRLGRGRLGAARPVPRRPVQS